MPLTKRRERFELIAAGNDATLREFAEWIGSEVGFDMVRGPELGMVMMGAADVVGGIHFNLGEVLVTQAEVEVAGERGWFMAMGRDYARALDGAKLDAAAEAGLEIWRKAEEALLADRAARERERRRQWKKILRTKVDFEVM